ncbi:hypothetical protein KM043_010808 [Ampulex compressa]|nr:hypothetical protein KM043_010808 [Ampulex compressa]
MGRGIVQGNQRFSHGGSQLGYATFLSPHGGIIQGSRKLCRGGTPRNTMATPPDGMLAQLEELKAPKHAASFDKPQARSRMLRTDRRELPYQLSGRRLVRSSSRLRNARFFH